MSVGYSIRVRTVVKSTPQGAEWYVYAAVNEYLKQLEPVVKSAVQQKMRRGVSPYVASERASVETAIRLEGSRLSLRVFSTSVRAAVDEEGANYKGIPPRGPGSALMQWVREVLKPKDVWWTSRNVAMAIQRRGLPRLGDPLRRPFAATHEEQEQQIRLGLRRARSEAVRRFNSAPPGRLRQSRG